VGLGPESGPAPLHLIALIALAGIDVAPGVFTGS
jgi:hypothetical protein